MPHGLGIQRLGAGTALEQHAGYSRAVSCPGLIAVSGTAPVLEDGGCPPDARGQVERCFQRISDTLALAGSTLEDVIRTRLYVCGREAVADVVEAHGDVMRDIRPACTLVLVDGLLEPSWLVEIEADAWVAPRGDFAGVSA